MRDWNNFTTGMAVACVVFDKLAIALVLFGIIGAVNLTVAIAILSKGTENGD